MAERGRMPNALVELLRLFVVVFFAGLGYYVAEVIGKDDRFKLGAFGVVGLGLILGSALGYVLGGILGRSTMGVVAHTEAGLRDTPAEQIVAGVIGAVLGVLVGAAVSWPVFLAGRPILTFPVFGFVIVTLGLLGFRLGTEQARRDAEHVRGSGRVCPGASTPPAALPRVLDTSVAIDGRILDVVRAGFLHGEMLVPSPVLGELQGLADASDDQRRARGRRGLEVLETLRREPAVDVQVLDDEVPGVPQVDAKLVRICLDRNAALLTLDSNLAKVAALAGVHVMNLHALAIALRPPVGAGDDVTVLLLKPGKESGQAVGYLDDGTMVVVERARDAIGSEISGAGDLGADDRQRADGVRPSVRAGRSVMVPSQQPPVTAAIVPAAGRGERLGPGTPKALRLLGGAPLLVHAVRSLARARLVDLVVVAAPPDQVEQVRALLADHHTGAALAVLAGGTTRQESVRRALAGLPDSVQTVLVHDAARPLAPVELVDAVAAAVLDGEVAVVPGLPVADTVKRVEGDAVAETLDRTSLRAIQTPQGFARATLEEAHLGASDEEATDDAALVERLGRRVAVVPGAEEAFKVTRPLDMLLAEAVLGRRRAGGVR